MKLIESNVEYIPQAEGLEGIYKMVELAGRTAYKSEDKITEDSAKKFVDMLIRRKHYAALEHGTVYLEIPADIDVAGNYLDEIVTWTKCHPHKTKPGYWAATTNYRVIVERGLQDDLQYLCSPSISHSKRYTFKFTCDRGISHELVRHKMLCVA